jgi:arsenate reductase-like glutaredoxin family protein
VREIDWYYHRPACAVCKQVQDFLARRRIKVKETVFANQHKLGPDKALELAHGAENVWAIRGTKIVHYDMTTRPPGDSELLKGMLAPSGHLRAPTVLHGSDLIVGFHEGTYTELLG